MTANEARNLYEEARALADKLWIERRNNRTSDKFAKICIVHARAEERMRRRYRLAKKLEQNGQEPYSESKGLVSE